jgi:hypothetical protein
LKYSWEILAMAAFFFDNLRMGKWPGTWNNTVENQRDIHLVFSGEILPEGISR